MRILDGSRPLTGQRVRLRYAAHFPLSAGTSYAVQTFSANGMYDPDITSTGHQPMGFDQWMLFYNHYNVQASKIKVTAASNTSTTSDIGMWGVMLAPDSTTCNAILGAAGGQYTLLENGFKNFKFIGNHGNAKEANNSITASYSQKKMFGTTETGIGRFSGSNAANPTEQSYYSVWIANVDGNTVNQIDFIVEIEYIATFSEFRTMTPS